MPSQPQRPQWGETRFIKSQVEVSFTIHDITSHFTMEEDWTKMRLNEPGRQKIRTAEFLPAVGKARKDAEPGLLP